MTAASPPSPPPAIRHLLIPGAAPPTGAGAALPALPHLDALMHRLRVADRLAGGGDEGGDDDGGQADPHELALARAHGLPGQSGRIPWAAFDSGTVGTPCAWLRPAHIQLGMDEVQLIDPALMALTEADSQALLAACAPLLAQDGIDTQHTAPGQWLARGALLDGLRAPAPAQAVGRQLSRAQLVRADDPARQRQLVRLQSELEMLLAAHPVNAAREAARQWPVNTLWIHGAGRLPAPVPPQAGVQVAPQLLQGDAPHDAAAHATAWQAIDATHGAPLLAALRASQPVRLTLAGPRRALTLVVSHTGLWQRISSLFGRQSLQVLRKQL